MQIIQNFDATSFILNNIKYIKNFIVLKTGINNIQIINAYDSKLQLLSSTHYSQVRVDGIEYNSQAELIHALAPILFYKESINGGGSGSSNQNNFVRVLEVSYGLGANLTNLILEQLNTQTEFTIADNEIYIVKATPIFNLSVVGYVPPIHKFILKNLGKNISGQHYGLGGIQLTANNIELIYSAKGLASDVINQNTQFINIDDLDEMTISEHVNQLEPSIEIQEQSQGTVIFNVGVGSEITQYWYLGYGGVFGLNDNQTFDENFTLLNQEGIEPLVDLQSALDNGSYASLSNIVEIIVGESEDSNSTLAISEANVALVSSSSEASSSINVQSEGVYINGAESVKINNRNAITSINNIEANNGGEVVLPFDSILESIELLQDAKQNNISLVTSDSGTTSSFSASNLFIPNNHFAQITEAGVTGFATKYRIDNPNFYGNIGNRAVDLTFHIQTSTTIGATGGYSFTSNYGNTAAGLYSNASGLFNVASSYGEIGLGIYGTIVTGNTALPILTDRLLNVGAGFQSSQRKDAFTILKNGLATLPIITIDLISGDTSGKAIITKEYLNTVISGQSFSGLEEIIQSGNTGWRFSSESSENHGLIGEKAIDLSVNDYPSTIVGAIGYKSVAIGPETMATGYNSVAIGTGASAESDSFSIGRYSIASNSSFAIGGNAEATGYNSVAFGNYAFTSADYGIAIGSNAQAVGNQSTAIGAYTIANGDQATALGYETEAAGDYSTAFGRSTEANGDYSVAFGNNSEAGGYSSFASGDYSYATGSNSIAIGNNNQSNGVQSTSFGGYNNIANADNSTVLGYFNTSNTFNETVLGAYAEELTGTSGADIATEPIFRIGAGTYDAREDGFKLLKNGLGTLPKVTNTLIYNDASGKAIITKEFLEIYLSTSTPERLQTTQLLNFGDILAGGYEDINFTFSGAVISDFLEMVVPYEICLPHYNYFAWVSNLDTITVRLTNTSASTINPSGKIFKFRISR